MAAAIATMRSLIEDDPYPQLERTGRQLMQGLEDAAVANGMDLVIEGLPAVFHTRFGPEQSPIDHAQAFAS